MASKYNSKCDFNEHNTRISASRVTQELPTLASTEARTFRVLIPVDGMLTHPVTKNAAVLQSSYESHLVFIIYLFSDIGQMIVFWFFTSTLIAKGNEQHIHTNQLIFSAFYFSKCEIPCFSLGRGSALDTVESISSYVTDQHSTALNSLSFAMGSDAFGTRQCDITEGCTGEWYTAAAEEHKWHSAGAQVTKRERFE